MKEAVNFLRQVYEGSLLDVANILTAEANGDTETIKKYLAAVRDYTEGLINKIQ